MKRILFSIVTISIFFNTNAQTEYSDFTSTGRGGAATTFEQDYHCLGINPANLGYGNKYEGKKITFGLTEFAISAHTTALEKSDLRAAIEDPNRQFSLAEKLAIGKDFATAGLALNFDMTIFGISYHDDKIGGFGFAVRERIQWYSVLNETAADIMFNGYNNSYFTDLVLNLDDPYIQANKNKIPFNADGTISNDPEEWKNAGLDSNAIRNAVTKGLVDSDGVLRYSELLDGTRINFSWTREFNFSYGKDIELSDRMNFYGGLGIKYIQGFAIMDLDVKDGELINAYSALSPSFGIEYGDKAISTHPNLITEANGSLDPVGKGLGFDFGVAFEIDKKLKFGFSIVNVGSITWSGTVFEAVNDTLFDLTNGGFNSYNFFDEGAKFSGEEGVMEWSGIESKTVALPSMMRIGASYDFAGHTEGETKADIGIDIILPLNRQSGNIDKPVIALGGDFRPVKWLDLSTGFRFGGNYGFNIPLGVDFVIGDGTWEAGLATRDVVTFFTNTGPTLSLAMGVLRFRF